ncbi:MAG TPA: hypothetical protein PL110_02070, partial [Candidatus Eremiobacteraeota bacterium]|nr:hypothetical protein [Candidatus Eremiobacteraeota bacterium]
SNPDYYQNKIPQIKNKYKRKEEFSKIKNTFSKYTTSVGESKVRQNPPPVVDGIGYISSEQLDEFYDKETGFKREGESVIW